MEFKYYLRGLGLGVIVTAIIMGISAARRQTMTNEEIIARAKELGMIENTVLTESVDGEPDSDAGTADEAVSAAETDSMPPAGDGAGDSGDKASVAADGGSDTTDGDRADAADGNGATDSARANASDGSSAADRDRTEDSDKTGGDEETSEMAGRHEGDALETAAAARQIDNGTGTERQTDGQSGTAQQTDNETDTARQTDSVITVSNGDGSFSVSKKLADAGAVNSAADFDTFLCENGYDKKIRAGTYTIPADAGEEQMAKIITGAE